MRQAEGLNDVDNRFALQNGVSSDKKISTAIILPVAGESGRLAAGKFRLQRVANLFVALLSLPETRSMSAR